MIKDGFFPTIIYAEDFKLDTNQLAENIIQWSKEDPGVAKTNRNAWHSTTDMQNRPEYKPLINELFKMVNQVFEEEFLTRGAALGNMWANINPPGGYNQPHVHPNAVFSGVYYVKAPPNSGRLVCQDPRPGIQTCMPDRKKEQVPKHLWRDVRIEPKENRAIMFNSWLWHSVEPNMSNETRISVSYNFIQKGFD
jgi:uncharacterized protein (TIGR02466 family)|tara:strand:+ start:785 stop:1366 length:582 start_codon:yes stop_codon:yes gene_type:complete